MRFSLIIDDTIADLFQDESVVLNRQIKDFTKIDTVFTDFSQSFQIPATDINNKIFANYFSENIDYPTWSPSQKLDARIEIDAMPVFYGAVELMAVDYTDGLPQSYQIAFYGQTKNIMATWGEQSLRDVDWSTYDHSIDNATMVSSWSGGLFSGAIVWDLKDYNINWGYSNNTIENNLAKGEGITYEQLRPSIRLKDAVQHVFSEAGYTLSGTLFDRGEFTNLYFTPMNTAGPFFNFPDGAIELEVNNAGTPITVPAMLLNQQTADPLPVGSNVVSDPTSSWDSGNYQYTIPTTGDYVFKLDVTKTGVTGQYSRIYAQLDGVGIDYKRLLDGDNTYSVYVSKAQKGSVFQFVTQCYEDTDFSGTITITYSPYTLSPSVVMSEAFPDIKITDFVNSIMKMFNAILLPVGTSEFEIHNIDDYYEAGANKEYTQYIDFKNMTHKKMPIPREIKMDYEEGESAVDEFFKRMFGRQFGSLSVKPDVDFAEDSLEIKSVFNIFPAQRIKRVNQLGRHIGDTDIDMPTIIDQDGEAIQQKLILFYFQDFKDVDFPYQIDSSTYTYQPVSAPYTNTPTTGANSISVTFGLESSAQGDIPTQTFYMNFWNRFISRLYSTKSRIVICDAYIPVGVWLDMELNDNIAISGNYYKIQKITYDILTEKAKLELITYPAVENLYINSVSELKPEPIDGGSTNVGESLMKGPLYKQDVTNSSKFGSEYWTDASNKRTFGWSKVLTWELVNRHLQKQLTLNRINIWDYNGQVANANPTPSTFLITETGILGQDGLFSNTSGQSDVTINETGQYKIRCWAALENFGNHPLLFKIQVNGIDTDGQFDYSGGHSHTIAVETSLTIEEGGNVTFGVSSNDGGSYFIDILKINMSVEKIF
jgi:hypothetical protein